MTYSSDAKRELCRLKIGSRIEALLELSALSRMNATLRMSQGRMQIRFLSESPDVIRRTAQLSRRLYGDELPMEMRRNDQLQQTPLYQTFLEGDIVEQFLEQSALDMLGNYTEEKERVLGRLQSEANGCAYLRGAFLGGGSIVDPEKSYHLEMVIPNEADVWIVLQVLASLDIPAKRMERRGTSVVYLKDSESIASFLVAIGATQAMLKLEDVKAMKDLRNGINRKINAETANMDKSIEAAFQQIDAIEYLARTVGLDALSEGLSEMCFVRLRHPEANMRQLGELLNTPIGKSGVNHRLKRLLELAEQHGWERKKTGASF